MTETAVRSNITLKGSAQMIREFFFYGINSILYQRGIYPSDNFDRVKQYGITLLVNRDHKLQQFLKPLLEQVEHWLSKRLLKKLILVLSDVSTKEVLERWQFDIENEAIDGEETKQDEKKVKQGIADVIKQIVASVAFLPLLETQCAFDVLIYTGKEVEMPEDWADSSACLLENPEEVQLRCLSTGIHKVHTKVQYKADL
uniref:Mitotic spindle assembly checkpoint protein MAD2A n=1 Tax=Acrobeloides nanus TaxID=290746 RepID=A0A914E1Q3_9BILA